MQNIQLCGFLILVILGIISCDENPVVFDGQQRHHAIGKVVDKNGMPLENVWVYIRSCKSSRICLVAGLGKTDLHGNFSFMHTHNDGYTQTLHINDHILNKYSSAPNFNYYNASITFRMEDYESYFKDWGEVGLLDSASHITIVCNDPVENNKCIFSVSSRIMDVRRDGGPPNSMNHKNHILNKGDSLVVNVPKIDTLEIGYWGTGGFFTFGNSWKSRSIIMRGKPQRIRI